MSLLQAFKSHLQSKQGFTNQHTFLVAVSGGVDSIVLCDLMDQCGIQFIMAHCNFQLRGAESERDENFVNQLAEKYQRQLYVNHFDTATYAAEHKLSTQVAARELRYTWFRQLLTEGKASYIVTAHHADDNIETVVMNFFRGTGLKGLVGMDEHFEKIWRPLLPFSKQTLLVYAKENALEHVEDSSNATSNYTRNYFRNELLPAVAKVFPAVSENIQRNISRFTEAEQLYRQAVDQHKLNLLEPNGSEIHIPILKLKKAQPLKTIVWEIISDYGFTAAQVDEVIKLMDAGNGSYIETSLYRIIKNRRWFIISPVQRIVENSFISIEATDKNILFAEGNLVLQHNLPAAHLTIVADKTMALLDDSEITFPLLLRKWKQGDYFYPLGMQKKKKLNRFFIDQKLSTIDKEKVWVLESNKRIVWVVGQRIDDRFKMKQSTATVLKITLEVSN